MKLVKRPQKLQHFPGLPVACLGFLQVAYNITDLVMNDSAISPRKHDLEVYSGGCGILRANRIHVSIPGVSDWGLCDLRTVGLIRMEP